MEKQASQSGFLFPASQSPSSTLEAFEYSVDESAGSVEGAGRKRSRH